MKISVYLLAAATLFLGITSAFSQEAGWTDAYTKAVAQAKTENKAILLDFTGSDWCGWCMKLKKETFSSPQFTAYAQKNLVCVTVDFPHNKSLPPVIQQQNERLKAQYQANMYPTCVLIDKAGRELGRQTGYLEGGPTAFLAKLGTFYTPAPAKVVSGSGSSDFDTFFKKTSPAPKP